MRSKTKATVAVLIASSLGIGVRVSAQDFVSGEVLLVFKPGTLGAVADQVIAASGVGVIEYFEHVDVYHVTVAPGKTVSQTVGLLKQDANVEEASPNYYRYFGSHLTTPNDPQFTRQWGLDNTGRNLVGAVGILGNAVGVIDADIDAPQAWEHTTNCSGEVVAILDSGVDITHPDFGANPAPPSNIWVNPGDSTFNGADNDANGIIDDVNGANFAAYEMHAENVMVDGLFQAGEAIYYDVDATTTVTAPDVLLSGPAQVAGSALVNFGNLVRHAENVVADGNYNAGESVYLDADNDGMVDAGEFLFQGPVQPVGTALINFVRISNNNVLDVTGHGTNVASVVGAFGKNGLNIAGVCWRVQLLTVKVARPPAPGTSFTSDEIAGINYIVGLNAAGVNVRVINFSAGGLGFSAPERAAIAAANAAGILFVTVADNTPRDNDGGPETIYRDADGSASVTVGDVRLTGIVSGGVNYFAGTVVAAGDNDVGSGLVAFAATEGHADPDGSANYTAGEAIYRGPGAAVAVGDTRLTLVSAGGAQFGPGSVVAAGDPDIGTALIGFLAIERQNDLLLADGLLAPFFAFTPCVYDVGDIVCVAASNNRDNLASFSAWGATSVDLAAPGRDILMLQRTASGGGTTFASGTSFAAPHVAGIAAHFWSLPGFGAHTVAQVKTRILTGLNGPLGVAHPHGVDPRFGLVGTVLSGSANPVGGAPRHDGRARMTMGDDFGDAPDPPYPTLLSPSQKGARHEDIGEEWLGRASDLPAGLDPAPPPGASDVSPEFDARDVPASWPPDPDGKQNLVDKDAHDDGIIPVGPFTFSPPVGPPNPAVVHVFVTTENNTEVDHDGGRYGAGAHGGNDGVHAPMDDRFVWVNAFFDWNNDGDWGDPNEHVFTLRADPSTWAPSSGGYYRVMFNMPVAPAGIVSPGKRARFRLDYGENLGQPLAAPTFAVGPSPGGLIDFWDFPGLPSGAATQNRHESVPVPPGVDLSLGVAQFGEVEDYLIRQPDQLHIIGPIPNDIPVTETGLITANVQDQFMGLSGQAVVFTKQLGTFTFTSGVVSPDGTQSTVITDVDGQAVVTFVADAPGDALIEVTVTGAPLSAFSFFDIVDSLGSTAVPPEPPPSDEGRAMPQPGTEEQTSDPSLAPSSLCGVGLGQIMIVSMGAWFMLGFTRRRRPTAPPAASR